MSIENQIAEIKTLVLEVLKRQNTRTTPELPDWVALPRAVQYLRENGKKISGSYLTRLLKAGVLDDVAELAEQNPSGRWYLPRSLVLWILNNPTPTLPQS